MTLCIEANDKLSCNKFMKDTVFLLGIRSYSQPGAAIVSSRGEKKAGKKEACYPSKGQDMDGLT